jgi:hypothetical protein
MFNKEKRIFLDYLAEYSNIHIDWNDYDALAKNYSFKENVLFAVGSKERIYTKFAKSLAKRFDLNYHILEDASHDIISPNNNAGLEQLI